jgi:hypothetical protein
MSRLLILIAVAAIGVGALDDIPHMHPVIQQ